MQRQKCQNDLGSFPRQAIQHHSNPSLCSLDGEEAEVYQFYEDLEDLLELTPKKDVLFILVDLNAKVGRQEILGVTGKFGVGVQNKAGQRLTRVLPREATSHSKYPLPATEEMTLHMDITRWSIPKSD